eukprot:CAMPEP_0202945924 /NCGR_PEP_ID=MMETSP1395-20130829/7647_1 /ASSEMBLY_ACC=CAM_ASM_000871 /TAXON_ID=5961 /ORGANISM="Blepharisma japonicum, Strain Stock R1072" /LENGTH=538 /DNA_ID=CAMNT_0049646229 /DNA_START=23 /DNA_END=1639 /DNA_ORIENTATION=+
MESEEFGSSVRLFASMVKSDQTSKIYNPKHPPHVERPKAKLTEQAEEVDVSAGNYGTLPLIQSVDYTHKRYFSLSELSLNVTEPIWIRARVHNTRFKGKLGFIILRDTVHTFQCTMFLSDQVSRNLLKFASDITKESIIDVYGTLKATSQPVQSCSINNMELETTKVFVVSKSQASLPFQLDDAGQPMTLEQAENERDEDQAEEGGRARVSQKLRLNNRVIDLRLPTNQAIYRVSSGVCQYFREFLIQNGFVEIHTPKLIPGTSEGGTEVFKLDYFGREACLAQSPQLYKQMAIMGDLDRVFEIGPVFRAENSNTHRHLCEFVGLDLEMAIKEHYFEVLEMIHGMFIHIFKNIETHFATELQTIYKQFPFIQQFQYTEKPVWLTFHEAVALLNEAGNPQSVHADFNTATEKQLGAIVKERYHTDFYVVHRYPQEARPFYTMLCADDPEFTNSYDIFMRGEEIISGAQRIHDPAMLRQRAIFKGIDVSTIKDYLDSFKFGAHPHGGCGVGLERVVMLFVGLKNIRWTSMFPRDPKRISP